MGALCGRQCAVRRGKGQCSSNAEECGAVREMDEQREKRDVKCVDLKRYE